MRLWWRLIFTVFFLFEVVTGLRIHPLQYALAGIALSLFFMGFLALSEFWPVGRAYGVAAAAGSAMVALYAQSFLRAGRRSLLIGGGLGGDVWLSVFRAEVAGLCADCRGSGAVWGGGAGDVLHPANQLVCG